jgi:hypothetical protein
MSTREIDLRNPAIGTAVGQQHMLTARLRKMEKAGEIQVGWQHKTIDPRSGKLTVPYIRLKSLTAVKRERIIRWTVFWVSAAMAIGGALYALWTIRMFILTTLSLAGVAILVLRFLPHLSRGCSGIHCSGCRG